MDRLSKKEIKEISDAKLVYETINTYGLFLLQYNCSNRGTKGLEKYCRELQNELVIRNLLTEEDNNRLNS